MSGYKNIQWFPGHMAKARRELKESLKYVDLIAEILDARIPLSSGNPEISEIIENKPRIVVLNKTDLSDDFLTARWINFYKRKNISSIPFSIRDKKSIDLFINKVNDTMCDKIKNQKNKGIVNPVIRIMIVGIPNVGKSSVINKLCGNSKAKVENRPGVTRRNQWFIVNDRIHLLDTPGVLWPKFENKVIAYNLAFTGAIKDNILDVEDLAVNLIEKIRNKYFGNLCERFKINSSEVLNFSSYEILERIGRKRGILISGGEVDISRTSQVVLEEFRNSKLGKITLEVPDK